MENQSFAALGYKDIRIIKLEFETIIQFLAELRIKKPINIETILINISLVNVEEMYVMYS